MEDYKLIPLTQGKFAIVDPEDYDRLSQFKWHVTQGGYAKRSLREGKKKRDIYMHRLILDTPSEKWVDHINGNKQDNRRCNLRLCTQSQNSVNTKKYRENSTSQYKGVSWDNAKNKWRAVLSGKHIAHTESEEEAARFYDAAARFYYGAFAITNFPGEEALSIRQIKSITRMKLKATTTSRFDGVYQRKGEKKWIAAVGYQGKQLIIGRFSTEEAAAIARDQKVKELGLKTRLNLPD